jgi:hypothetical protein
MLVPIKGKPSRTASDMQSLFGSEVSCDFFGSQTDQLQWHFKHKRHNTS